MSTLTDHLTKHPVIYVTRDIERALGLPLTTAGYFIIANSTPFAKVVADGQNNVLLIQSSELLNTHELLSHPDAIAFIEARSEKNIVVFKNTSQIEKICAEHNWKLLNPSAVLAQTVEDKISQIEWLGDLNWFLPEHKIHLLKEVWFDGTPFIVQFNRAHTGNGTILIDTEEKLNNLKAKFPDRPVRVTKYVEGMMLTSNNIVTNAGVMVGNVSCQITGIKPFTDQPFATIGNDWNLGDGLGNDVWYHSNAGSYLYTDIYYKCVEQIGNRLREQGWRGLFGLDFVFGIDNLFLIEINARQPASTTFESQLQNKQKQDNKITTFEAHLMSLLDLDLKDKELIEVNDGAQIIIRNQVETKFNQDQLQKIAQKLTAKHFNVIPYTNTTPGSDLLRIQSDVGIMKNYKKFNEIGEKIICQLTELKNI